MTKIKEKTSEKPEYFVVLNREQLEYTFKLLSERMPRETKQKMQVIRVLAKIQVALDSAMEAEGVKEEEEEEENEWE